LLQILFAQLEAIGISPSKTTDVTNCTSTSHCPCFSSKICSVLYCRYRSPLEELKDLLRRTSQVEKSLCQIEASEDSCRSPEARGQQEGQRAERPKLGTGPDNDRQGAGDGIGRTEDGDIRIGRTWGEERYPQTEAVASQKILGHAQCPARSTVRYNL